MAPGDSTPGRRRVPHPAGLLPNDLEPGDYWYVEHVPSIGRPAVFFLPPTALAGAAGAYERSIRWLPEPPHIIRLEPDTTITVTGPIAIPTDQHGRGGWRGDLTAGVWREA